MGLRHQMRQDEENGIPEGIPEMGLRQQMRQGEESLPDEPDSAGIPSPLPLPHPTIQALREGGEDGVVEGLALRAAPSPSGVPGWVGVGSG